MPAAISTGRIDGDMVVIDAVQMRHVGLEIVHQRSSFSRASNEYTDFAAFESFVSE